MGSAAKKAQGAYYTDPAIAAFLVRWAVRSPFDRVLDPGAGEGVFLRAAAERLADLGGGPVSHILGIELDPQAYRTTAHILTAAGILSRDALICGNFFDLDSAKIGRFTAVVGNPPFIRYQRFAGARRTLALKRAAQAGIKLTALTSAWAPFIAHGTTFLEPGGRLAMVAPAELCHAAYAFPVLQLLRQRFSQVWVLTFAKRLFPELSEDIVLVLGEGYGQKGGEIRLVSLPDASTLTQDGALKLDGTPIETEMVEQGAVRLIAYLLPTRIRELYQQLIHYPHVVRLGTVAKVGIGYVTGNNDFFHLSTAQAHRLRIPIKVLTPAVLRAAWLSGLTFMKRDWNALDRRGYKTRLLNLAKHQGDLPTRIKAYLEAGKRRQVHKAYKCRVRDPWYVVPHVAVPDLFLTYMANARPALVLNPTQAVAPNTLLCVRLDPLAKIPSESLTCAWWTSLTALSAEIEGHSLGGGMLKLEPGEAAKVLLPLPSFLWQTRVARRLVKALDSLVRREVYDEALDLGDREILEHGLGLSPDECRMLRQGFNFLMNRRRGR